jgi:cysteine desulfurase
LPKVFFHVDAAQAAGWLACNVNDLGVDFLTLSAHKLYGPKGVGVLFVRGNAMPQPGTPNVPAIVGMAAALREVGTPRHEAQRARVQKLRDSFCRQASSLGFQVTGIASKTSPGHAHIRKPGLPADIVLTALGLAGIAASAGSACASNSTVASPVLLGMGWTARQAGEAVRISLGSSTTSADVAAALEVLGRLAT